MCVVGQFAHSLDMRGLLRVTERQTNPRLGECLCHDILKLSSIVSFVSTYAEVLEGLPTEVGCWMMLTVNRMNGLQRPTAKQLVAMVSTPLVD